MSSSSDTAASKPVTREEIYAMLEYFGVRHDDCVMVHTSLRRIGEIEGRAEAMLDAFCSYLSDGLFLVPTHTWGTVCPQNPLFDVRRTVPSIGVFPQIAAREAFLRENAVRSLHPTHSIAAFGRRAKEYVIGEENRKTRTGPGSAWARLYDENAKILLLGVGLDRNTYMHVIEEELYGESFIRHRVYNPTVIRADGSRFVDYGYSEEGPWSSFFFPNFERPFLDLGILRIGKLGNAQVRGMEARRIHDAMHLICRNAGYDVCGHTHRIPEKFYKTIG